MKRLLWKIQAAGRTLRALLKTSSLQRVTPLRIVVLIVFLLALLFAFLSATSFLSPFIYPLF